MESSRHSCSLNGKMKQLGQVLPLLWPAPWNLTHSENQQNPAEFTLFYSRKDTFKILTILSSKPPSLSLLFYCGQFLPRSRSSTAVIRFIPDGRAIDKFIYSFPTQWPNVRHQTSNSRPNQSLFALYLLLSIFS